MHRAAANGNKDALFYLMGKTAEKYRKIFAEQEKK